MFAYREASPKHSLATVCTVESHTRGMDVQQECVLGQMQEKGGEVGDRARLVCVMSAPVLHFPRGFWRPLVVPDLGKEDLARVFSEELSHSSAEGKTFFY